MFLGDQESSANPREEQAPHEGEVPNVDQNDVQVSDDLSKEHDQRVKLAHRYINNITIECERRLSKNMRTTDPVRNEVWEAVSAQARLAYEGIKSILDQMKTEYETRLQELAASSERQGRCGDAWELLHIAGLDSVEDIEGFLDRSMQDSEDMQKLRELFECERNKIVEAAQQMKWSESGQEQIIYTLRKQIETYQFQMAELAERVESLGQSRPIANRDNEGQLTKWQRFKNAGRNIEGSTEIPLIQGSSTSTHATHTSSWPLRGDVYERKKDAELM
ncbi:hypothetical protein Aduo_004804 [Ancylostoma duodenale]